MESVGGSETNEAGTIYIADSTTAVAEATQAESHTSTSSSSSRGRRRMNNVEPSFECTDCGKKFSRRGALEAHWNTHTGAKPYKCEFPNCEARFAARSNMVRHRRVHGQEFANAAASPKHETTFEPPIVNDQVVDSPGHVQVQWMQPNQASRGYIRYTVPAATAGLPSSSSSAQAPTTAGPQDGQSGDSGNHGSV